MKQLRVTAVNKPNGTITVMWDGDESLEWNFNIPIDDVTGEPMEGDDLLRHLINESYDTIASIRKGRADQLKRDKTDFKKHGKLFHQYFNVEEMVREFEEIRNS